MKSLVFDFANPSAASKSLNQLVRLFVREGCAVASAEIDTKVQKTAGVAWRAIEFVFVDNQKVSMRVKLTGDIFQVLVNGKQLPIREQDDPAKAVGEISNVLDMGRASFQKKLARVRARTPQSSRREATTKLMLEKRLSASVAEKRELLEEGKAQLASITAETAALRAA